MTGDLAWLLSMGAVGAGIVFCALRAVRGPTDFDRVLALDAVALHCVAVVVLLSLRWRTSVFMDFALVLALLGFVVTVAVARSLGAQHERGG